MFSWTKTRGVVHNSQRGRVGDFGRCGCGLFEIDMMMVSHYLMTVEKTRSGRIECYLNFRNERKEGAKMRYSEIERPFIENFPLF